MKPFAPIAIVGSSCVLPQALNPSQLWQAIASQKNMLTQASPKDWHQHTDHYLSHPQASSQDKCWHSVGGYIEGFDKVFRPESLLLETDYVNSLDPLFKWLFYCGQEALKALGPVDQKQRVASVIGNLSYPTESLNRLALKDWAQTLPKSHPLFQGNKLNSPTHWHNRFMSGLPAHLLLQALGLKGVGFCLDAACASSLYALKLACDLLHDQRCDLVLAGGVNAVDPLFLHVGFTALQALSPSGQSQPFSSQADGLLPSQGASLVVLKRFEDALADGDPILGLVRSIGLTNDGRTGGFLSPSSQAQCLAMHRAYELAQLQPEQVSYVECHATGTQVGDQAELKSLLEVFKDHPKLFVGSLKSNLGHLLSASASSALIKVLEAFKANQLPPMLEVQNPLDAFEDGPLELCQKLDTWSQDQRQSKKAAINAFGFGGNNAHMIVESYEPQNKSQRPTQIELSSSHPPKKIALCGMGLRWGSLANKQDVWEHLTGSKSFSSRIDSLEISLKSLGFPPKDLSQVSGQQLLLLPTVLEALNDLKVLPQQRTCVLMGMGTDSQVCKYDIRLALSQFQDSQAAPIDGIVEALNATRTLGCMPNIPANRLNVLHNWLSASYTVSAEELSGLMALYQGVAALSRDEADCALVGAVDLSCDPLHQRAVHHSLSDPQTHTPCDAAIVWVLKPYEQAVKDQESIYGYFSKEDFSFEANQQAMSCLHNPVSKLSGHAHCVGGLKDLFLTLYDLHHNQDLSIHRRLQLKSSSFSQQDFYTQIHKGPTDLSQTCATTLLKPTLNCQMHPKMLSADEFFPTAHEQEKAGAKAQIEKLTDSKDKPKLNSKLRQRMLEITVDALQGVQSQHSEFLEHQHNLAQAFYSLQNHLPTHAFSTNSLSKPSSMGPHQSKRAKALSTQTKALCFDRKQLEEHANGKLSKVFGAPFEALDDYKIRVRMPFGPLLLTDRVTQIDAEAASMGVGSICTQTDVKSKAWYLHHDTMPAGVSIEAGQADLFLISYLGVDFENQGSRTYRLLGCEASFHRDLPKVGETLSFKIHIDRHTKSGKARLFFFHYDCYIGEQLYLSVRHGQAGFFSQEELEDSGGVLWKAQDENFTPKNWDQSLWVKDVRSSYTQEQVRAFASGESYRCFGKGYELLATHTRSPSICGGKMLLFDEVSSFQPQGGVWQRGYMKAHKYLKSSDWFFEGHFKNDPCMPGTLMTELAFECLGFYLAALGLTRNYDGYRFIPLQKQHTKLTCRGQVSPESKHLCVEVYVYNLQTEPTPRIQAHVLMHVDGLAALHAQNIGVELVYDFVPLKPQVCQKNKVASFASVVCNEQQIAHAVCGDPVQAFGPKFSKVSSHRNVARLPGAPYTFMSRVLEISGNYGALQENTQILSQWDIDPQHVLFDVSKPVPMCVWLEALLQPCGWLASYMGCSILGSQDLYFRNLSGHLSIHNELSKACGVVDIKAKNINVSRLKNTVILTFKVQAYSNQKHLISLQSSFGFFTKKALSTQKGFVQAKPQTTKQLSSKDRDVFQKYLHQLRQNPKLCLIDSVESFVSQQTGLGSIVSHTKVDPSRWFFKAHFFKDPVMPGSLGIEAMYQLFKIYCLKQKWVKDLNDLDILLCDDPIKALSWQYKGQIACTHKSFSIDLEVIEHTPINDNQHRVYAHASLWVENLKIYEAKSLALSYKTS